MGSEGRVPACAEHRAAVKVPAEPDVQGPLDGFTLPRPRVTERIALSSTVTGGVVACLEVVIRPGGLVAPVHVHAHEDESVFVIEGTVSVRLGKRTLRADTGSMVFGPRGVPHTFWNEGDSPVRMMMTVTPGEGFETYFRGLPEISGPNPTSTAHQLVAHAARFGLELRPESLDELAQHHHVTLF